MQHIATAPKTLLDAAMRTIRQAVTDAAATITGAIPEGSPERMQLALDHLRAFLPQLPAESTREEHDARVADLIDAYADPTLPPECEKIARAVTSKAYKNGYCFATQKKIALWTRLPKSTLQLRLHEMERRDLIRVQRRPGTSSITLFADGTLDALRLKKIKKIGARERTAPIVTRVFSAPPEQKLENARASGAKRVESWPKNTTCSVLHPTVISLDIPSHNHARAQEEKPEKIVIRANDVQKQHAEKRAQTPVQKGQTPERPMRQNGNEEKKKPKGSRIFPRSSLTTAQQNARQTLIEQGVSPGRAHVFAQLFEPDRIARNLALGLHCDKRNPAAYLLELIRDDPAAKRVVPGSEADLARRRERPPVLRGRYEPPTSPPDPPKKPPSRPVERVVLPAEVSGEADQRFEALSASERAVLEQRARSRVLAENPWLGDQVRRNTGPLMQAMIRSQLRRLLAEERIPPERYRQLVS